MDWFIRAMAAFGQGVRASVVDTGRAARYFVRRLLASGMALGRPRLVIDQMHFVGNRSVAIIMVSGLFVGYGLGLQGYYTLRRSGAEQSLCRLVALSPVREPDPVLSAFFFPCRARPRQTASYRSG